jgi:tRNA threonylcarbamoyladenosine biosynthesis protein TsaE
MKTRKKNTRWPEFEVGPRAETISVMKRDLKAPTPEKSTWVTHTEEETFDLAKRMARQFKGREVVFLMGELGAGKTIFAKGIAAGLGMSDPALVCSPCFTIMNVYAAKFPIFHFDLYRLENRADILDLGWEDYLEAGVVIVEWGERVPFAVSANRVTIKKGTGDERTITIVRDDLSNA